MQRMVRCVTNKEFMACKAVENFCISETEEYSFFQPFSIDETEFDEEQCVVYISIKFPSNIVRFKVCGEELKRKENLDIEKLELLVEVCEGSYEVVNTFSWRVKYFWIALLTTD